MDNKEPLGNVLKGNARCRAHEYVTVDGDTRYLVEVCAYNCWADQWKLVYAAGSLSQEEAEDCLLSFRQRIHGFSWEENEFEWEE